MKIKWLFICILILFILTGCGKTNLPDTDSTLPSITETQYSFDGTVFYYQQKSYDISEREKSVNQIMSCTPVGQYIIVEGHVGPKNAVYSIYNTQTKDFGKDIIGTNLIWHDNDINAIIYSFWSDVCAYDGNVIVSFDLSSAEFIRQLAFVDNNSRIEVTVETDTGSYTEKIELPA